MAFFGVAFCVFGLVFLVVRKVERIESSRSVFGRLLCSRRTRKEGGGFWMVH